MDRKKEEAKFEEWFKNFNTWDLTGEQFLQCCLKVSDRDSRNNQGVTVYISPKTGLEMTYYQASKWYDNYLGYKVGWFACLEQMEKQR